LTSKSGTAITAGIRIYCWFTVTAGSATTTTSVNYSVCGPTEATAVSAGTAGMSLPYNSATTGIWSISKR
jgi:hypothetical protein